MQNWCISALAGVLDLCWGTSFLSPLGQQLENPDLAPPSEILVPGAQGGALAQHPWGGHPAAVKPGLSMPSGSQGPCGPAWTNVRLRPVWCLTLQGKHRPGCSSEALGVVVVGGNRPLLGTVTLNLPLNFLLGASITPVTWFGGIRRMVPAWPH